MSYFEPSRRPFARRRIGSWTSVLDWFWRQRPAARALAALLVAVYVGGAASLCGVGLVPGASTGVLVALVLSGLAMVQRRAPPLPGRIALVLIVAIGTPALLVPAIVFVALGFWLLISLPLWLYRS